MKYYVIFVLLILFAITTYATTCPAVWQYTADALDTSGNLITAHDGSISLFGDTYYWYGTDYRNNPNGYWSNVTSAHNYGFNVYSSPNLIDWTYEGIALTPNTPGFVIEGMFVRPRVIYNEENDEYVMWFIHGQWSWNVHLYSAISKSPTGPFTIVKQVQTAQKNGYSNDVGIFKDDDGTGYVIHADADYDVHIIQMTSDYKDVILSTSTRVSTNGREAPVLQKYEGLYIIAFSGVKGWAGSETRHSIAGSPFGPYSSESKMSSDNTWNSQISDFFITKKGALVTLNDIWFYPDPNNLNKSRYYLMPVTLNTTTKVALMKYNYPVDGCGDYYTLYNDDYFAKAGQPQDVEWADSTVSAQCSGATDCVSRIGDCLSGGYTGTFDGMYSGLNPNGNDNYAYCYGGNGRWLDCDYYGADYCDAADYCGEADGKVPSGETTPFGEYTTFGEQECCGDDFGENYISRTTYKDSGRYDTAWASDTTDGVCCNSSTDCVMEGICYADGTNANHPNTTNDKRTRCNKGGAQWLDVDYGSVGCTEAGFNWSIAGESTGEYGSATNGGDGTTECCGDDYGEYYITTGNYSACCNNTSDTVNSSLECITEETNENPICQEHPNERYNKTQMTTEITNWKNGNHSLSEIILIAQLYKNC